MKAAGADMPLQRWPRLAKIALASGSLLVLFLGLALGPALMISALLLVLLIGVWVWRGGPTLQEPLGIMLTSTLIVLLVSPYLLNYDFVLLLVPLAILAGQERKPADWILLAGAYALPFVALALWGRQGNFIFPLCAAILVILSYRQRRLLDVSLPTAYNG
jgi:hypothetical protein